MKKLRTTLVELPATIDGRLDGRMAKDIYSLFRYPARGTPLLEAICREAGYQDTVSLDLQFNRVPGRLDADDWRRLAETDVLGLSVITRTANQSFELAQRVRELNPRVKIIFGGPHPTALPEESLAYGDIVVNHEGDHTLRELLPRLEDNQQAPELSDVQGISYRRADGEIVHNPDRPFLTNEQLSSLPFPVYSERVKKGITHNVINTSRGCPYECEFCSVIENFGRGFRFLDEDTTVDLIRHTVTTNWKDIFFGDDIFAANRARTTSLLERLLREGIRLPAWCAQVRVETAQDKELLKLMKRANCGMVCIGLESVNEETLKLYHKHSNLEKNRKAIEAFHRAGIRVHGMFVLGSDADTEQTLAETLEFARETNLSTAQFFALTTAPGTPLARRLAEEKRIIAWGDWHLFDAQHAIVCPAQMTPSQLQQGIFRISREFYSVSEAIRRLFHGPNRIFNFAIRIQGNRLARRIERDSEGFVESLQKFDAVRARLATEIDRLGEQLRGKWRELGVGLEDRQSRAKTYLHELAHQLEATCDRLQVEMVPYGKALREMAARVVESHSQALLNGTPNRTSFPGTAS